MIKGVKRRIVQELRPAYYDDFHCLMGSCVHSCCRDSWNISVDKKDYLKIKQCKLSPQLAEQLSRGMRRIKKKTSTEKFYAGFDTSGGVCPMLTKDGLCSLQLEKGREILPHVCRIFPRLEFRTTDYIERALSPACEEVLALLWSLPQGIDFTTEDLPKPEYVEINPKNHLMWCFQDIRSMCIDFLQDRRFALPERILLMGMALKELVDGEEDINLWMARAASLRESTPPTGLLPTGEQVLVMFLSNIIRILLAIPDKKDDFAVIHKELLEQLELYRPEGKESNRATMSYIRYQKAQIRYQESFGNREFFMENLMVALAFQMQLPCPNSPEKLWKSYVNFCNLYAFYRFMAVMSCREGAAGDRAELFRMIVHASRELLHSDGRQKVFCDEFFQHDSATLAHMAILLCG